MRDLTPNPNSNIIRYLDGWEFISSLANEQLQNVQFNNKQSLQAQSVKSVHHTDELNSIINVASNMFKLAKRATNNIALPIKYIKHYIYYQ